MTFNPALWRPIAIGLSAINLVGVGAASASAEPWHAALHATLALAFGLWAYRLRIRPLDVERDARLEALSTEINNVWRELTETQERLDFAERLLAKRSESSRIGPER